MAPPSPDTRRRFAVLASPRIRWWGAALAVVLASPSLGNGRVLDDHLLSIAFRADDALSGVPKAPFELFTFVPADPEVIAGMQEEGALPWWTAPDLRLSFWRPLSALTHALDYALFPDSVALMHLHNLLWLGALVLAASVAYRRLVPDPWTAGLATILFAVEDAHALPAGWLANRNALVAGTFAILALVAHDRFCRDRWRPGIWFGPSALAIALLSGEIAVCALAFLLAHALFLDDRSRSRRVLALAPYATLVVLWRVVYNAFGHGATGSGMYVDPVRQPLDFAAALVTRAPLLLFSQLGNLPSDLASFVDRPAAAALVAVAAVGSALIALASWPVLREDRTARFWAVGTLLSIVPVSATFANDRLLVLASLGGMGLVAVVLSRLRTHPRRRSLAGLGMHFLVAHVFVGPLLVPLRATSVRMIAGAAERAAGSAGVRSPDEVLVIVNTPQVLLGGYVSIVRVSEHDVVPAQLRTLGATTRSVTVTRTGPRALELAVAEGYFESPQSGLFHDPDRPWRPGRTVALSEVTIEVVELTADRRPRRITARFERPLDDPVLRWVAWRGDRYEPFDVPAEGERVVLPSIDLAEVFRP